MRQLRDAQGVDFRGNQIPAQAGDGSVSWIRLDDLPVMGRVVVISRHAGVASSYDCNTCYCPTSYTSLTTSPSGFDLIPGATMDCTCQADYTDCNNNVTYSDVTSAAARSSSNTAVASVASGGAVKGVSAGSATITAVYSNYTRSYNSYQNTCISNLVQRTGSSSCDVQKPTSLQLVATTSQGAASCSAGSAGWSRWVTWQVLDQNGQPIKFQMSVSDKIAIGGTNTCGASAQTGSTTTDAYGQFPDHYFVCSTGCVGGKTCETDASQTYTVDGVVLSLDIKSIVYKCTSITINGQ